MFSKACEYAIRAVLYVAIKSGDKARLGLGEIAKEIDSPVPFTAKILQTLVREGIISSVKGPNGGFFLDLKSKPIPLSAVVQAIDGTDTLHTCAMGLKECSDQFPCPLHNEVKAYKNKLKQVITTKPVQQLAMELGQGKTFLKNGKS
jgi:Rrf2 family protein